MTTWFVNSGAVGANNGTSWTDAWTSLASSTSVAAGDVVKVHKTHSQTGLAAALNWTNGVFANPVRVACVDKDNGDAPATGASAEWTTTALGPQSGTGLIASGMKWKSTAAVLRLIGVTNAYMRYENCTWVSTGSAGIDCGAGSRVRVDFINCDVDFSGASSAAVAIFFSSTFIFNWTGGSYILRGTQTNAFRCPTSAVAPINFRGVNLVGTVTDFFDQGANFAGLFKFDGCGLPNYTNLFAGGATPSSLSGRVSFDGCQSGTLVAQLLRPSIQADATGTLDETRSRYRSGGADQSAAADGSDPHSIEIVTTANAGTLTTPFETPQIPLFVQAGAQTLTFHIASGVTLTDAEAWVEVLSPSEAVSSTAQFRYQSTRCLLLATPAVLASDSGETWVGSGVGTKQKMSVTINPTLPGIIYWHFNLAKPTTTVYVCPRATIA